MDYQKIMDEGFKNSIFSKPEEKGINNSEKLTLRKKAYSDAYLQFYKTIYLRSMVGQFMTDGIVPNIDIDPTMKKLIDYQINQTITKPPFLMVTINPRPDVILNDLKKSILKFVSKKSVIQYFYVYEVRNEDGGLHCHVILKYEIKPYDFKRSAKNTFKNICDSSNPSCLNFRFIEEELLDSKINYLLGNKRERKLKGVEHSIAYRKKYNLEDYYESSPPLPCRTTQTITVEEI